MPYNLLLADDSVTVQRVIELTFSRENVHVVSVGDGDAAIARIEADTPDIVLADIGMPGRDGYDVAAFVKGHRHLRHIPVLLLAGAFEPLDSRRAETAGFDGVLVKPFEPQHVVAQVMELLHSQARVAREADETSVAPSATRGTADALLASDDEPETTAPPATDGLEPASVEAESRPKAPALDDYFERLDAALETRGARPPTAAASLNAAPPAAAGKAEVESTGGADIESAPSSVAAMLSTALDTAPPLHTASHESGQSTERTPARSMEERRVAVAGSSRQGVLADAFSSLLDLEQGKTDAAPPNLGVVLWTPMITSAFVDEVTRRVLTRLAPGAVREVVVQVVSDVADRLVREEIARRQ